MASSRLHQWESDPLFSAAEVVQDSADRMESIYRLLLHEQSLVQGDHPDPRLLTSIEYHKRDLATILETAKWQLEDFERAVNSSAIADRSRSREDAISRHRQFIIAIGEHINHVERSFEGPLVGNSMRNSSQFTLHEQDRDVLLFLTGGSPTQHVDRNDTEDTSILRGFLDPTSASSLTDGEIIEHDIREFQKVNMNGDVPVEHYSKLSGQDAMTSLQDSTSLGYVNGVQSDLEANEAVPKSFFQESKLRRFGSRVNFLAFLGNLWTSWGNRATSSYTKRLKDGEEQRHSPNSIDISQRQHIGLRLRSGYGRIQRLWTLFRTSVLPLESLLRATCDRYSSHFRETRHCIQIILMLIILFIFAGILVSRIA